MQGRFLGVEDGGELVVGSLDGPQELEGVEVFEGVEAVEGEVDVLEVLELSYLLLQTSRTWIPGNFLWVQTKSRKANEVPQLVLPRLHRCSLTLNCYYLSRE